MGLIRPILLRHIVLDTLPYRECFSKIGDDPIDPSSNHDLGPWANVTVGHGRNAVQHQLSDALMAANSSWFSNVLDHNARLGPREVFLPEISQSVFRQFQFWLQTGRLSNNFQFDDLRECTPEERRERFHTRANERSWRTLIDLLIFVQGKDLAAFHNELIDKMIDAQAIQHSVPARMLIPRFVQNRLPKDAPAYRLMVDWVVMHSQHNKHWWAGESDEVYPHEFLWQVLRRSGELRNENFKHTYFQGKKRDYHL